MTRQIHTDPLRLDRRFLPPFKTKMSIVVTIITLVKAAARKIHHSRSPPELNLFRFMAKKVFKIRQCLKE